MPKSTLLPAAHLIELKRKNKNRCLGVWRQFIPESEKKKHHSPSSKKVKYYHYVIVCAKRDKPCVAWEKGADLKI